MKTISLEQLRKQALSRGAELEVNGTRFNAGREQVAPAPKLLPAPSSVPAPAPTAPAERGLTLHEVELLLAERDAAWRAQIEQVTQVFSAALKALQSTPKPSAKVLKFTATYDFHGRIEEIRPVYAH